MGRIILFAIEGFVSLVMVGLVFWGLFTLGRILYKGVKASLSKEGKE